MPEDFSYKKGENIIDFFIPEKTLLPNDYIFSLGSSLKNTKWIINSSNFDVTVTTKVINNDKIFISKVF